MPDTVIIHVVIFSKEYLLYIFTSYAPFLLFTLNFTSKTLDVPYRGMIQE